MTEFGSPPRVGGAGGEIPPPSHPELPSYQIHYRSSEGPRPE